MSRVCWQERQNNSPPSDFSSSFTHRETVPASTNPLETDMQQVPSHKNDNYNPGDHPEVARETHYVHTHPDVQGLLPTQSMHSPSVPPGLGIPKNACTGAEDSDLSKCSPSAGARASTATTQGQMAHPNVDALGSAWAFPAHGDAASRSQAWRAHVQTSGGIPGALIPYFNDLLVRYHPRMTLRELVSTESELSTLVLHPDKCPALPTLHPSVLAMLARPPSATSRPSSAMPRPSSGMHQPPSDYPRPVSVMSWPISASVYGRPMQHPVPQQHVPLPFLAHSPPPAAQPGGFAGWQNPADSFYHTSVGDGPSFAAAYSAFHGQPYVGPQMPPQLQQPGLQQHPQLPPFAKFGSPYGATLFQGWRVSEQALVRQPQERSPSLVAPPSSVLPLPSDEQRQQQSALSVPLTQTMLQPQAQPAPLETPTPTPTPPPSPRPPHAKPATTQGQQPGNVPDASDPANAANNAGADKKQGASHSGKDDEQHSKSAGPVAKGRSRGVPATQAPPSMMPKVDLPSLRAQVLTRHRRPAEEFEELWGFSKHMRELVYDKAEFLGVSPEVFIQEVFVGIGMGHTSYWDLFQVFHVMPPGAWDLRDRADFDEYQSMAAKDAWNLFKVPGYKEILERFACAFPAGKAILTVGDRERFVDGVDDYLRAMQSHLHAVHGIEISYILTGANPHNDGPAMTKMRKAPLAQGFPGVLQLPDELLTCMFRTHAAAAATPARQLRLYTQTSRPASYPRPLNLSRVFNDYWNAHFEALNPALRQDSPRVGDSLFYLVVLDRHGLKIVGHPSAIPIFRVAGNQTDKGVYTLHAGPQDLKSLLLRDKDDSTHPHPRAMRIIYSGDRTNDGLVRRTPRPITTYRERYDALERLCGIRARKGRILGAGKQTFWGAAHNGFRQDWIRQEPHGRDHLPGIRDRKSAQGQVRAR
ncbi:hypothetical protein AURDEDRAFT_130218 [Auricularia subglabra TFB-10046 SS5]|uniref:Uncharacterized protein n=1 Tax=Auricularia subglabra (strain TFB-10046 / SS5) TaxID=717982 RepID=J0D903_AURST|nr:hypothetical protein AURDEDRAFT_130218 [Auricularia subglabra TFB-10046 SS5]